MLHGSNLPGPQIRDRIGRMPGGSRSDPVAARMNIQQIGPPLDGRALGAVERGADLRRLGDGLALDPKGRGGLGEVHIRIAVVTRHVAAGLELTTRTVPNPVPLI